jgi:hypothetical protein
MRKQQDGQKLPRKISKAKAMTAQNKIFLHLIILTCLAGCNSTSMNVRNGVIPDAASCRPNSKINSEISESQKACHQGISGNGVQVLISNATRAASMHSDTTEREMTSIFIRPASAVHEVGATKFEAFYSQGLFDLLGKTGCVGVLEGGSVEIKKPSKNTILNYKLRFRLVSPLGWLDDCKVPREITGSVEL